MKSNGHAVLEEPTFSGCDLIPPISDSPPSGIEEEKQDAGDVVAKMTGWHIPITAETEEFDPITKPAHYCQGTIEPMDFIEDQRLEYHEAAAVEYIVRARYKGSEVVDLKKAINHLSRKVRLLEKSNQKGGCHSRPAYS